MIKQHRSTMLDGTSIDRVIQENKRLRRQIVQQKKLNSFLEHSPDAIFIHDYNEIVYVNQAFLELYGYENKEDILGQKLPEAIVHPDDHHLAMEYRTKTQTEKLVRIPMIKTVGVTGKTILAEASLARVNVDGIPHLQVTSRDISERVREENHLKEVNILMKQSQKLAKLGSWQWDIQGNSVTWSDELFKIYGLNRDEFGASFESYLELVHPEDRERIKGKIQEAVSTGDAVHFEERIVRPDGQLVYLKSWGQVIKDLDGKASKMFGACLDISARKQSELDFLEKEHQLERLFDNLHSSIVIFDQDANIKYWNKHATETFGYDQSDAFDIDLLKLLPPSIRDRYAKHLGKLLRRKGTRDHARKVELEGLKKDGRKFPIELSLTSWKQGKSVFTCAIVTDITARKKAEKRLRGSEKRLRELFDTSLDGIYKSTPEGRFVEVNAALVNMLGYDSSDDLLAIDIKKDLYFAQSERDEIIVSATDVDAYRLKKKNGEEIWVEDYGRYEYDGEGNIIAHMGIMRDITERRKANLELQASIEKYNNALKATNDAIWDWDLSTDEREHSSEGVKKVFGFDNLGLIANLTDWLARIHPHDRKRVAKRLKDVKESKRLSVFSIEYRFQRQDEEYTHIHDRGYIIRGRNNKPIRIIGAAQNITKRKTAENNLVNTLNITMEQNKRLLNFAYIVSHNLRSHSSNISGILNLIEATEAEEEKVDLMSMLKSTAGALDETMRHLNNVVSIQTKGDIVTEDLFLADYVNKTKEILSEQIQAKGALVVNELDSKLTVKFNVAYLESVLLNFMSNALKYAHPERRPKVHICSSVVAGHLHLKISDNGIGIDLERHGANLFGMYKTFHGNKDARGIGLFISKNQIEAMGGSISVESEIDKGTTFTIKMKR